MAFLDGVDLRPVDLSASPFTAVGLALGQDDRSPLEVVVAKHSGEPNKVTLRSAWKARQGGRWLRCCSLCSTMAKRPCVDEPGE